MTPTQAQIEAEQERHDAQVERYVTLGTVMRFQTIERCARLAESMGNLSVSRKDTICREIAAAIRKLKDEMQ
jgi:hypothetical protein